MHPADKARFLAKISRTENNDDCWIWISNKHKQGYGFFKLGSKNWLAHRIAFALENNLELKYLRENINMKIIHTCDNPSCCNPKHLIAGSQNDNIKDMILKGRRGACNSKLTLDQVRMIRSDPRSDKELALIYNMTENGIYYARTGRNWNQNQEPGPQQARSE